MLLVMHDVVSQHSPMLTLRYEFGTMQFLQESPVGRLDGGQQAQCKNWATAILDLVVMGPLWIT